MKTRLFQVCLITLSAITLFACAPKPTANMKMSLLAEEPSKVDADKALVYFARPSHLGFLVQAAVYDGDQFIGFVPYGRKLPYMAKPGKHLFMVVSEAADFMKAELLPGKTYYAEVVPRMGAWRARFSLAPVDPSEYKNPAIDSAPVIKNKPEAYEWAKNNNNSVQKKKSAYYAKWKTKGEDRQPFLKPEYGE